MNQFLRLIVRDNDANGFTRLDIDLRRCKFDIYVKSSLKIQNRTVNTDANNEADDVDNVPLYGKQFEGSGNYVLLGDNIVAPSRTIQTNLIQAAFDGSSPFSEVPGLKQVVRAKRLTSSS